MLFNTENFKKYFLTAQEEGNEVYVGDGAALVIYREDKTIGLQVMEGLVGLPSEVFCDYGHLQAVSSEFIKYLNSVCQSENRVGLQPHLTDIIKKMYRDCALWHEKQDVLSLLEDNFKKCEDDTF